MPPGLSTTQALSPIATPELALSTTVVGSQPGVARGQTLTRVNPAPPKDVPIVHPAVIVIRLLRDATNRTPLIVCHAVARSSASEEIHDCCP